MILEVRGCKIEKTSKGACITMEGADISFVHLGITIQHLSNSISVFGFRIAYYGIIIGLGMLAGIWVAQSDAKRRGQDPELYLDFALYGIIFSIIGARVLTLIVFTLARKVSFFSMADTGVLGLVTGQIIGRWGNFFNREAFGGYTDSLFAMRIKRSIVNDNMLNADVLKHMIVDQGVEYIQVHPTFLYESCWNLGLLCFMLWYRKRKKFDGEMLWIYLLGYGTGRFWIESLRTDQLILFGTGLPVSQVLSFTLVCVAAGNLIVRHRKLKQGSQVS